MALHIVPANIAADGPTTPPARTRYAMSFDNGRLLAFADSFYELMCALSPGYEVFEPAMQASLRADYATAIALPVQSMQVLADAHEREQACALEDYAALLHHQPYEPADVAAWLELPAAADLLLPCTETASEHAHVLTDPRIGWVCAATEESLIRGLHEWSVIRLMHAE